jgi:hypothetical protein
MTIRLNRAALITSGLLILGSPLAASSGDNCRHSITNPAGCADYLRIRDRL